MTEKEFNTLIFQLNLYARDQGKLGKGSEFNRYAARFLPYSDELQTLTFISNPNSVDRVSEKKKISIDLHLLDAVLICISLFALPSFTTAFITFPYLKFLEKETLLDTKQETMEEGQSSNKKSFIPAHNNVCYLITGALITCVPGSAVMVFFQVSGLQQKHEWFYFYPYIWLWFLIIVKFFTTITTAHGLGMQLFNVPRWIEGTLLWIACMTIQLLSWHLVFVLGGLILNPLRASLYCVVIISGVVCTMVLLATITKILFIMITISIIILKPQDTDCSTILKRMQIMCTLLFHCADMRNKMDRAKMDVSSKFLCVRMPFSLQDKFPFVNITILFSLVMLLVFMFLYGVFILQANVSGNMQMGGKLLDEVIKLIVPKMFMVVLVWFATKLFLSQQRLLKLNS